MIKVVRSLSPFWLAFSALPRTVSSDLPMDVGPENRNVKLCHGNKIVTDYLCSDNICNSIALHLTPDPAGHVEEERLDDHIDGDDDDGHGDVSGGVDG